MLTGENGIVRKASTAKDENKKAEYEETLKLIGTELKPEQVMEQLSTKEYMDRYETKIQEEIDKQGLWKGATKERKNDLTIWVTTKEGWIYEVTEKEVKYLGNRTENPEPPTLQAGNITFSYEPENEWAKEVVVKISTNVSGFKIQYTTEEEPEESEWKAYPNEGVKMTENGNIHARLINGLGETTAWATGNVSKIDRINPIIDHVLVTQTTSKSITISVSARDQESGLATSNAYQYYLGNTNKKNSDVASYTYEGLSPSTSYTLKVVVYDKAGNPSEKTITQVTGTATVAEVKGRF